MMRHRVWHKKLGRNSSHRRQLLRNLTCSLIQNERITTTLAKAKSLKQHIEPVVTKGKTKTLSNIRLVRKKVLDRKSVGKMFNSIGPRYLKTDGGYTKITRVKLRHGDGATQSLIEFV